MHQTQKNGYRLESVSCCVTDWKMKYIGSTNQMFQTKDIKLFSPLLVLKKYPLKSYKWITTYYIKKLQRHISSETL